MQNILVYNEKPNEKIDVAIIFARYKNEWLFCKHRDRGTWEIPGGHIEENEDALEGAKRELYEESGAIASDMRQVCYYSIKLKDKMKVSVVYLAEVNEIEELPNYEMKEIKTFKEFPDNVTYKETYEMLLPKVKEFLRNE